MIVAITAYNRPRYLEAVLDSIETASEAIAEPVFLVARIEASPVSKQLWDLIDPGRGTYVTVNRERLGHVRNILQVMEDAWLVAARFGEDYVLRLDDDVKIAPDALVLAAYMRERYRSDMGVLCTGLFDGAGDDPLGVSKVMDYCSQGVGIWESRWPMFVMSWEKRDTKREFGNDPEGYRGIDNSVRDAFFADWENSPNGKWSQARPDISRAKHIGLKRGMHTTPETFALDTPKVYAGDIDIPEGHFRARP